MSDTSPAPASYGGFDERDAAMLLGVGRMVLGVGANVLPRTVLSTWVGDDARAPGAAVLARALGARDMVLGAAQLHAASRDQHLPTWLLGTALCDGVDALASLSLAARQPGYRRRALLTAAVAGAVAAGQVVLARRLADGPQHA